METTKLSSKGQIILPKAVRDAHQWQPGTEFVVEEVSEGILLRPRNAFPATRLEDVIGCAGYHGPGRTLEEMDAAIARGVKERRERGRY